MIDLGTRPILAPDRPSSGGRIIAAAKGIPLVQATPDGTALVIGRVTDLHSANGGLTGHVVVEMDGYEVAAERGQLVASAILQADDSYVIGSVLVEPPDQ
jgi:hypothetical protein